MTTQNNDMPAMAADDQDVKTTYSILVQTNKADNGSSYEQSFPTYADAANAIRREMKRAGKQGIGINCNLYSHDKSGTRHIQNWRDTGK